MQPSSSSLHLSQIPIEAPQDHIPINTPHLFDYNGTLMESRSPNDLVAFEVWDELADGDATIHFAMFFWADDLHTKAGRGKIGRQASD